MKRSPSAASPGAYVAALAGWQRGCVEDGRAVGCAATRFDEVIKWNNLDAGDRRPDHCMQQRKRPEYDVRSLSI